MSTKKAVVVGLAHYLAMGAGMALGWWCRTFVEATVGANARALPRGARARAVLDGMFATHGWKLALEEMNPAYNIRSQI